MATGWNITDALNAKTAAAAADNRPKARFRTKDISIKRMYSNKMNFYSMPDIEELAQEIFAVGLLENLVVVYDPTDQGEYRIIAGERRWRALQMLLDQGHEEFEMASCQIKTPAEEHEEIVQLIVANTYRNKTVMDVLEEEKKLKDALQYMKDNGLTLQGYTLDSGRLRDVIADMMQMPTTKIAQIESINKRLIPEFTEELKEGRLTFSAAYEISGLNEEKQKELLERYQENGLTFKEVKEIKKQQEEEAKAKQIEGQMSYTEDFEEDDDDDQADDQNDQNDGEEEEDEEEWQQAHPESITSLCYSCQRYSDCNVKTGTCESCDRYINKTEAEKTDEQRYNEEQDRIDRETKKKLDEMAREEKLDAIMEENHKEKFMRMAASTFQSIASGQQPYLITKNDSFRSGQHFTALEFSEGKATGQQMILQIIHMDDDQTSSAIAEGYCVLGIKIADIMKYADQDTAADAAAEVLQSAT